MFLLFHFFVFAQREQKTLHGKIISYEGSKEGVTVINVTNGNETISDDKGYFDITGQTRDTLRFISPLYLLSTHVISESDFDKDPILFPLERNLTGETLDEIVITKKTSNIYTYKSKGPSPVERQLASATSGIITPIVNWLNGRTAMLKKALAYEREGFKVDKLLDYVTRERLMTEYHIPYDYAESFAFYAVLRDDVKDALDITPVDVYYLEKLLTPIVPEFLELIGQVDKKTLNKITE